MFEESLQPPVLVFGAANIGGRAVSNSEVESVIQAVLKVLPGSLYLVTASRPETAKNTVFRTKAGDAFQQRSWSSMPRSQEWYV
jgi:hypothetical protein